MRPYVIEVAMVFAAGLCVGAWLNEQRHMEESMPEPVKTKEIETAPAPVEQKAEKKKKGWYVSLKDGKLVIDPNGKKRFFFF